MAINPIVGWAIISSASQQEAAYGAALLALNDRFGDRQLKPVQ
jgi:hypothetical protein